MTNRCMYVWDGTFSKPGVDRLFVFVCHSSSMDRMKEEMLKRMPEWFLKLRKRYMEKYNDDLFDLLDELARMADE